MNPLIWRYRLKIVGKRLGASVLSALPPPRPANPAPITVFISSLNTRYPLELTLRTLTRCTRYPDYRLCIADNGSTDGSREFLEALLPESRVESRESRVTARALLSTQHSALSTQHSALSTCLSR